MDYILTHQHEDGWLGLTRYSNPRFQDYDPWPASVLLKAMIQYQQAAGDNRQIKPHVTSEDRLRLWNRSLLEG